MFKLSKTLLATGLVAGGIAMSGAASAECVTAGKVGTIWSYNTGYSYIGIAPESAFGEGYVVYYYVPASYSAHATLLAAAASDEYVYVSGDASSCPTSGVIRYGGTATFVFHSDFQ